MRNSDVLTIPIPLAALDATLSGARRAHVLHAYVGRPEVHDLVRFVPEGSDVAGGVFVRVTYVEMCANGAVFSYQIKATTGRYTAAIPREEP